MCWGRCPSSWRAAKVRPARRSQLTWTAAPGARTWTPRSLFTPATRCTPPGPPPLVSPGAPPTGRDGWRRKARVRARGGARGVGTPVGAPPAGQAHQVNPTGMPVSLQGFEQCADRVGPEVEVVSEQPPEVTDGQGLVSAKQRCLDDALGLRSVHFRNGRMAPRGDLPCCGCAEARLGDSGAVWERRVAGAGFEPATFGL